MEGRWAHSQISVNITGMKLIGGTRDGLNRKWKMKDENSNTVSVTTIIVEFENSDLDTQQSIYFVSSILCQEDTTSSGCQQKILNNTYFDHKPQHNCTFEYSKGQKSIIVGLYIITS